MNHAISLARTQPSTVFLSPRNQIWQRTAAGVRLREVTTGTSKPERNNNMNKTQDPNEKAGDVMSDSFGEGYATRSDEEGFGGIYGGNQSQKKVQIDKEIHENHPAYDKTQGSEVKEKEKARHQTNASS